MDERNYFSDPWVRSRAQFCTFLPLFFIHFQFRLNKKKPGMYLWSHVSIHCKKLNTLTTLTSEIRKALKLSALKFPKSQSKVMGASNHLLSIAAKRCHLERFMIQQNTLSAIFWPLLKTTDWKPHLEFRNHMKC